MDSPHLTVIVVSDSHFGAPSERFADESLSERILRLSDQIPRFAANRDSFIMHLGDVAEHGTETEYEQAREAMDVFPLPVYYVRGNHDALDAMRRVLPPAGGGAISAGGGVLSERATATPAGSRTSSAHAADTSAGTVATRAGSATLDYTFVRGGEQFVVLDATHPHVPDPHGYVSPEQQDWLRDVLDRGQAPATICIHYPPFLINSPWAKENMGLVNADDFLSILDTYSESIRVVLAGHVHQQVTTTFQGIPVIAVGSMGWQYRWAPLDRDPVDQGTTRIPLCVLEYYASGVHIRTLWA